MVLYLDVRASFAFFGGGSSIFCRCCLGDIALAGRHCGKWVFVPRLGLGGWKKKAGKGRLRVNCVVADILEV